MLLKKIFTTCLTNKILSSTSAKECPGLVDPSNGNVEIDSEDDERLYPAKATYSCNSGYDLDGEKTRQCQIDGTWDEDEPSCDKSGRDIRLN